MLWKKSHSLACSVLLCLLTITARAELDGPDMYVYGRYR